jgi:hypothetical protein
MATSRKNVLLGRTAITIFFLVYFLFFLSFNGYHLLYQEQTQLFLFNFNYFSSFLMKPGGLCSYIGAFFTQFYQNPFIAALIVTLFGIALFFISVRILNHYRIKGLVWPLIPVILLATLQSHHLYLLESTTGLIISCFFFAVYISVRKNNYRYLTGLIGCSLAYFISGGFALLAFALCLIHELVFTTVTNRFGVSLGYLSLAFLIPIISSKLIYYVKGESVWISLIPLHLEKSLDIFIYAIILYFPVLLIVTKVRRTITKKESHPGWNWKTVIPGFIAVGLLLSCIIKFVYDEKTEILLKIDHYVQNGEWNKALKSAYRYPGSNQLVLYYGNMALYKTGQMGDKMFNLPQAGVHGLWLEWKRNEVAPFFGGELFYQLGYISEAYRWAFEAMVARGENPRSLKRLAITSIISGDTLIAKNYLNILNETLFYKKWAQHYQNLVIHPELQIQDNEIMEKRRYEMRIDILADKNSNDIGLLQLVQDHPDNRMAFEYYMAWLLLNKDLDTFADNIYRIKELGYSHIPVHYEEAMLAYMDHTKKNIIPAGYQISQETLRRLSGYLQIYNSSGNDRRRTAQSLFKNYGGTYWFYMNFFNLQDQRDAKKINRN